ncbi:acyl-homoserine-lactone synthase [Rhodobacteraceae bacterium DSL-40]|uniref:acyl-homoserine-lactone synthase n=1 Tax=Amaricoccus sp. B4 TaxID=3368557 RepID=UPI000DAC14CA
MIHYLYRDQLERHPELGASMYRDRAFQFKDRLDWDVSVDENGFELDEYDHLNPLYIIWKDAAGRHGGSLRVMPTVGRTMTAEHFLDLTDGVRITSPFIWECTRFCLAPGASSSVAGALLAAGLELGLRFGLEQAVGVIYTRVLGLYRRFGHVPEVIGTKGEGNERISVCIWDVTEEARNEICRRSGVPEAMIQSWFDASFPSRFRQSAAVA